MRLDLTVNEHFSTDARTRSFDNPVTISLRFTHMSTPTNPASPTADEQLSKWLNYLAFDPGNLRLLENAALAAFDSGQFTVCRELLERPLALDASSPSLVNLRGLLSMTDGDYQEALAHFSSLEAASTDPVIRYNMAYASAMLERHEQALAFIDEAALLQVPASAVLRLRTLHHLGRLDEAIDLGRRQIERGGFDAELPGALASACFDTNQLELARQFASVAPETPDSQTVLGMLALDYGMQDEALERLERALAARPSSGRAQLGMGLCLLSRRESDRAAAMLDSAATNLKRHAGSWIAAGWAHLFKADLVAARKRFEHAGEIDRGLAEAPGGLAVVACREGNVEEARRLVTTALRLDSRCLAAALASSMLAAGAGDQARSNAIMQRALDSTIESDGQTLGSLIARHLRASDRNKVGQS